MSYIGSFFRFMAYALGVILTEQFNGWIEFECLVYKWILGFILASLEMALEFIGGYIIAIIAIYLLLGHVFTGRAPHMMPHVHHFGGRFIRTILAVFREIFLFGIMLILGSVAPLNHQPQFSQVTATHRTPPMFGWTLSQSFTYTSLHFQAARLCVRAINRLLGFIPYFNTADATIIHRRETIAHAITLFLVLWGFWRIPGEIFC